MTLQIEMKWKVMIMMLCKVEEEKTEQREKVLLFYSAFGLYTSILQEFTSEF